MEFLHLENFIPFLTEHIHQAPYVFFGLLMLAGLNFPISEDLMIFSAALLAAEYEAHITPLYVGILAGAYLSDLLSYWIGRHFGRRLFTHRFFARFTKEAKIHKIEDFYSKYGVFTLLVGRFIPFGVRNALFITAGFSRMNFVKFAIADFIAAITSVSLFFYLYYNYGFTVVRHVKQGNIYLFMTVAISVLVIIFFKRKKSNKQSIESKLLDAP